MKDTEQGAITLLLILLAIWYFWSSDEYRGFFYPDKDNLSNHVETGIFDTLKECVDVTTAYGDDMGISPTQYDYECGLNCKQDESIDGIYVCEETFH